MGGKSIYPYFLMARNESYFKKKCAKDLYITKFKMIIIFSFDQ